MIYNPNAYRAVPVGIVIRRQPGVTRWQKWHWTASGVLLGAGPETWRELRRERDVVEFHADTLSLELHGADAEAYKHNLQSQVPSLYLVMRDGVGEHPYDLLLVTASPYEAQDYTDSGEEIVEKVAMPSAMLALVQDFVAVHYQHEEFIKRKRDKKRVDLVQDGIGDPRVGTAADVYASPSLKRRRVN